MRNIFISILIGVIAGTIDIVPMIVKKLDRSFIISAFLFYIVLGLLVQWVNITETKWLNGLITGLLLLIPVICLIYKVDRKAVPVVILSCLILSSGVGFLSGILLK